MSETLIALGLALVSCSDDSSHQALTLPEDMHANKRAITATAEYDRGDSRQERAWSSPIHYLPNSDVGT